MIVDIDADYITHQRIVNKFVIAIIINFIGFCLEYGVRDKSWCPLVFWVTLKKFGIFDYDFLLFEIV